MSGTTLSTPNKEVFVSDMGPPYLACHHKFVLFCFVYIKLCLFDEQEEGRMVVSDERRLAVLARVCVYS